MIDLDFHDEPSGPAGNGPPLRVEIYGEITDGMESRIKAQLAGAPEASAIDLFVDSNGGDFGAAFNIFIHIRRHRAATKTAYITRAESGAAMVMLAADLRILKPGGTVLLHSAELVPPVRWTADQHTEAADLLRWLDRQTAQIFAYRTGQSAEVFAAAMRDEETAAREWLLTNNVIHEMEETQ